MRDLRRPGEGQLGAGRDGGPARRPCRRRRRPGRRGRRRGRTEPPHVLAARRPDQLAVGPGVDPVAQAPAHRRGRVLRAEHRRDVVEVVGRPDLDGHQVRLARGPGAVCARSPAAGRYRRRPSRRHVVPTSDTRPHVVTDVRTVRGALITGLTSLPTSRRPAVTSLPTPDGRSSRQTLRRYWPPTSKNASRDLPQRADPHGVHEHLEGVARRDGGHLASRASAAGASAAWRAWKSARRGRAATRFSASVARISSTVCRLSWPLRAHGRC